MSSDPRPVPAVDLEPHGMGNADTSSPSLVVSSVSDGIFQFVPLLVDESHDPQDAHEVP